MNTNHRYLDVMTMHSTASAVTVGRQKQNQQHSSLLIEPVMLPNMDHIQLDSERNLAEPCLFYPNGEKNKNLRREIENTVVKHHLIERSQEREKKKKDVYRVKSIDKYAHVQGPPLYYGKKADIETDKMLLKMRKTEKLLDGTVALRL